MGSLSLVWRGSEYGKETEVIRNYQTTKWHREHKQQQQNNKTMLTINMCISKITLNIHGPNYIVNKGWLNRLKNKNQIFVVHNKQILALKIGAAVD